MILSRSHSPYSGLTLSQWIIFLSAHNQNSKQFNYLLPLIPWLLCWWQWCNAFRSPVFPTLNLLNPDIMLHGAACGGISLLSQAQAALDLAGKERAVSDAGYFCSCCIINGAPIKIRWTPDTLLQIRRKLMRSSCLQSRPCFGSNHIWVWPFKIH